MEKLYQESLKKIKSERDISALSAAPWSYLDHEREPVEIKPKKELKPLPEVTQKAQVLDSLHKFGSDKLAESGEDAYRFEGGEITAKSAPNEAVASKSILKSSLEEIKMLMGQSLDSSVFAKCIGDKNITAESLKLLFVTDSYQPAGKADSFENDNECFFEKDVAILFSRMIKAMGVELHQVALTAVESTEGVDLTDLLYKQIGVLKPKLIVTLGARATSEILGLQKRLKDIHGEFYPFNYSYDQQEYSAQVMPLFSPTLLQTAPNMKKTAWKDMQKLMLKI